MTDTVDYCAACSREIVGTLTIGNGLRPDGRLVCGLCSTFDDECRRRKQLMKEQGGHR